VIDSPEVFGIVRPYRACDHDGIGVAHRDWFVSDLNVDSICSKRRHRLRLRSVRARNENSSLVKHSRNPAHSASTDSDEVDTAKLGG
jgi:hypothetical protein